MASAAPSAACASIERRFEVAEPGPALPGELGQRPRGECRVIVRLRDGGLQACDRGGRVRFQEPAHRQGPNAGGAARRPGQQLVNEHPGRRLVRRQDQVVGLLHRASMAVLGVSWRREADGLSDQLDGGLRGTPVARRSSSFDDVGRPGIRTRSRQREMTGAVLKNAGLARGGTVEGPPPSRRDALVRAGREQRVGEPDLAALLDEDTGADAGIEARAVDERGDRHRPQDRHLLDHRLAHGRDGRQLASHQLGEGLRQCPVAGTSELEGEERVAGRAGMDSHERMPGDVGVGAGSQEAAERTQAQPGKLDLDQAVAEGVSQAERVGMAAAERNGEPDRQVANAADGERECAHRGEIEPLDVVDRDHDRRPVGEEPQRADRSPSHEQRITGLRHVLKRQGRCQRPGLRFRQVREDLRGDGAKDVAQARVPEGELGLDRTRGEHADAGRRRQVARCRPDARLADPGLAADAQSARAARQAIDPGASLLQRRLATDELCRSDRGHPRTIQAEMSGFPRRPLEPMPSG